VARSSHTNPRHFPTRRSSDLVVKGDAAAHRWLRAARAGAPGPGGVVERPDPAWGLAARGALVEAGAKPSGFDLDDRDVVWADIRSEEHTSELQSRGHLVCRLL